MTVLVEPADGGARFTYRVDAASGSGGVFDRLAVATGSADAVRFTTTS